MGPRLKWQGDPRSPEPVGLVHSHDHLQGPPTVNPAAPVLTPLEDCVNELFDHRRVKRGALNIV